MTAGAHETNSNYLENLSFTYKENQTGYATSEVAVLFQSLEESLLVISGELTSNTSKHILPTCSTFAIFDKQDGELLFVDKKRIWKVLKLNFQTR